MTERCWRSVLRIARLPRPSPSSRPSREAPDQPLDDVGPDGGVPGVAQLLRGELEIERRALPRLEVGRELAQSADQVPLKIAGGGEPLPRAVLHAQLQEHGDGGVVRGDAQSLEIGHRLAQPPAGQPAGSTQIVRADPLVGSPRSGAARGRAAACGMFR